MMEQQVGKIGRRGTVVLPAKMRKRFGLTEGTYIVAEAREEGILLRPAVVLPFEQYSPERVAEFLLGSATDKASYEEAREEVCRMGLDPESIDHFKPHGI